ncbi:MAG: peptidylprolyl isomerase [Candidatus Marinimicrobia bacterium]|nr:peptidylprolyl isomerase [Candidatus Neomarinimicrobiota bacterium]
MMGLYRILLISTFAFIILFNCSTENRTPDPQVKVVATVDDISITETSFQRAFMPVILYGNRFDSEDTRKEVLNILIGQKLLAWEAQKERLDTLSAYKEAHGRAMRKALSRKVYKEWVKKSIKTPTEPELREGFNRSRKAMYVRHLFAKSKSDIQDYEKRIASGEDSFYSIAREVFSDSTLSANGGALGWITFGDLDETLEDTLYKLKPGRISHPVQSQFGWHLLAVDDIQEELTVSPDDFLKERELIYKKIYERREIILEKKILNDFMSQFEIVFNRDITKIVWPELLDRMNANGSGTLDIKEYYINGTRIEELKNETLLTVNGEIWSVQSILERLPEVDRVVRRKNLYVAAANVIRDEMLAREAQRLGYQNHPDVLEDMRDSDEQVLAEIFVSQRADTLNFTSAHQKEYFLSHQTDRYHAPDSLLIELFAFNDSLEAGKAIYRFRTSNSQAQPSYASYWLDESDQNDPAYKLTRSVTIGTMAGPLFLNDHWTLIRLVERRRTGMDYEEVMTKVLADMEHERFNATRDILLREIKPAHTITINYEQLNQ